jgi:hypothetical protein
MVLKPYLLAVWTVTAVNWRAEVAVAVAIDRQPVGAEPPG